jgi:hypothetical protein
LYLPRALEARETLVEDRTKAHADHVGHGPDRVTTAAVGLLKAIVGADEWSVKAVCFALRYNFYEWLS